MASTYLLSVEKFLASLIIFQW